MPLDWRERRENNEAVLEQFAIPPPYALLWEVRLRKPCEVPEKRGQGARNPASAILPGTEQSRRGVGGGGRRRCALRHVRTPRKLKKSHPELFPMMLWVDNWSGHISLEFKAFCKQEGILLMTFRSHSTMW